MHRPPDNPWLPLLFGACTVLLSACGGSDDGIVTGGSGGGAGDGDGSPDNGPSAVEPFVGLWDIKGPWSGITSLPEDEATLVIRPLRADGSAEVVILDFDDGGENCSFSLNTTGTAAESPIDGRVFLDGLPDFVEAVLSLNAAGDVLTLQYTDQNDIDDDGNTSERVSYSAPAIPGLTEADVPLCSRSV